MKAASKVAKSTPETTNGDDQTPSTAIQNKVTNSGRVEFHVETVTPDVAAQYLDSCEDRQEKLKNRKTRKNSDGIVSNIEDVKTYAAMMKAGAWTMNGMPIIFDRDGKLIDGVARLEACVLAGVPFRTNVAVNVRKDTLHTIDQHRRRIYTGILESRGVSYAGAIQSTMTKLIRIENGTLGMDRTKISWSLFDRVLDGNPELQEAVSISEGSKGSLLHSTPRPTLSFMALKAGKREELRFFLAGLKDIDTFPLGNPVRMLANQLKAEQRRVKMAKEAGRSYEPMYTDTVLAIAILAFNDFCNKVTREEEYFWVPDYGDAKEYRTDRKKLRELAPANLGFPVVEGYPGLTDGKYLTEKDSTIEKFSGETAQRLIQANADSEGNEVTEIRTVTPQKARELLKLNRDNRALSDSHKRTIAKDIRKGNWMLNAQPICFTGDPDAPDARARGVRLLNGQHRLHGCIEADTPIEVPIAKYISPDSFATYDAHSKKMRMKSGTGADDRVLRSAARLQWKEDNDVEIFSTGISPSASEILETIELHPGLAKAYPRSRALHDVGSSGVMTYLIYHVSQDRPDLADDFLEGLRTGENLEARNPILSARTKIVGHRTADPEQRVSIPRKEVLKTLINSWRDYKTYRDEIADDDKQQDLI